MNNPKIYTPNVAGCFISGVGSVAAAFLGFPCGLAMLAV